MTSPLWGKYCDGGHYCSAPKECCSFGCCYHTLPTEGMFGLWFLGHWYFWALVTILLVAMVCVCSLWRRCWHAIRCILCTGGRDERASEPDSTGSCYAPPHYSRCSSFHHAPPPPYTEVTSKPDLYPLVISYNGATGMKRAGSASYLMVQYFRNYILRPSGSISATSTIDSLSSSFICNAANEANTIIPPPYSCTGSLEGFTFTANPSSVTDSQMLHSASSLTCNEYQQNTQQQYQNGNNTYISISSESPVPHYSLQNSPKFHSNRVAPATSQTSTLSMATNNNNKQKGNYSPIFIHNKTTSFINNMSNPRHDFNETIVNSFAKVGRPNSEVDSRTSCDQNSSNSQFYTKRQHVQKPKKYMISTENSIDSETSQGDEHNFSELLNLSVCVPSSIGNSNINTLGGVGDHLTDLNHSYSIANSVTVSDISSLANLGTPDSPPRATSPTVEIRELLDKIQQLPQQKSPAPEISKAESSQSTRYNKFFIKSNSKTLYMPLNTSIINTTKKTNTKLSPKTSGASSIFGTTSGLFSYAGKTTKGWLSKSAPTTPCGNFIPLFPSQRQKHVGPKSNTGSKSNMDDASALLKEYDGSDDEQQQHNNENEHL